MNFFCCFIVLFGFFFSLFQNIALVKELDPEKDLSAKVSPEDSVLYDALPVNNGSIPVDKDGKKDIRAIPFPVKDPSADALRVIESYQRQFHRQDGRMGDVFIPYDQSIDYVLTRPNGNDEPLTHDKVQKAKDAFMEEKEAEDYNNKILDSYFFMRHRVLTQTMKK